MRDERGDGVIGEEATVTSKSSRKHQRSLKKTLITPD